MESFATPYALYFDDGDGGEPRAMGHIGVHSVLTYRRFQALMSQKVNLAANQLSAVFVCRRTVRVRRVGCKPSLGLFWQGLAPRPSSLTRSTRSRARTQVNDVEKRQKLPVNENTNFCIILNQHNPSRERDAHFLVSIKKSKKDRKGAGGARAGRASGGRHALGALAAAPPRGCGCVCARAHASAAQM
jgi:hypothetical protein